MARRFAALLAAGFSADVAAQQQQLSPPKWLSDSGKDLFMDVWNAEESYTAAACEDREKLLKAITGNGEKEAGQIRATVLFQLGLCEFKKGEMKQANKRILSGISEMNLPNEEVLLNQMPQIPLMKQATELLAKHAYTEGAVAARRTRVVLERQVKKILKNVHKQMEQGGQAPPLKLIEEEVSGYGKTGQYLPQVVQQLPYALRPDLHHMQLMDEYLDALDKKMAVASPALKAARQRLDVSKGKSAGQLLYVRALLTDAISSAESLLAAQEFESKGVTKAFLADAEGLEKAGSLIKRSKKASACKEKLEKTCDALLQVADVQSNGFGESRVMVLKGGKSQQLDSCTTNANVGILLAAKAGVKVTVGSESQELEAGKPVVVDFCQQGTVEAKDSTPVLFAQAWHPEFAAIERTTELRLRSEAFALSEDDLKAATKVVNDNAKKSFDKGAKTWRTQSSVANSFMTSQSEQADQKKREAEAAAEEKRKTDFDEDDERKKGLEELEKKRAAKAEKERAAEEKRKHQQKVREQERAMRDPWLNAKEVQDVEAKIEDLKGQRRDANAKLEFETSTALTKEISAVERELKRTIKKAKKAHKKAAKASGAEAAGTDKEDTTTETTDITLEMDNKKEVEDLKKQLKEVNDKKKAAAKAEKYAEAKKLKAEYEEIQAKIKKLEL